MSASPRPRIAVFSLGGTIAMLPGRDGTVIPALTGDQLLSAVPGLDGLAVDLDVHDFRRVPGAALSFADVYDLAAAIRALLPGPTGPNGPTGPDGTDGPDGPDGPDGTDGTTDPDGTGSPDGVDGRGSAGGDRAAGHDVTRVGGVDGIFSVVGVDRAGTRTGAGRTTAGRAADSGSAAATDGAGRTDGADGAGDGGSGEGIAGVVVSQGTDTIEETAFLLDLLLDTPAPVVVTGAMRHPSLAGADGPGNLLAAIRTAASAGARGLGCLVVMSDEIHAARWVRKIHASSTAAFIAPSHGPLGHVVEGAVHIPVRIDRVGGLGALGDGAAVPGSATERTGLAGSGGEPGGGSGGESGGESGRDGGSRRMIRVGLATVALGDDGELLAAMGERADGLVVAGFGVGHVPAATVPALRRLAERIPVVLASRTGAGSVHATTYGFPGSERDLQEHGLISAGHLDPLKARVLLHVLLAAGAGRERIAAAFETIGHAYAPAGKR